MVTFLRIVCVAKICLIIWHQIMARKHFLTVSRGLRHQGTRKFCTLCFLSVSSISLHICWLPCRRITLTLLAWLLPFVPKVEFGSDPRGVSAKFLQFVAPSVAGSVGNPCQASRSMVAVRTRTCTGRWPGQLSRTLRSPWTHRSKWSLMCSKMSWNDNNKRKLGHHKVLL